MDASDGATKNNGNGHADPAPVSLPSAEAAPQGAPVSSSNGEGQAGAPAHEPLVVVDRDPITGRFPKGKSGNPKGRTPGIPNKNTEFLRLLTSKELRHVWATAKKLAAKGDVGLMQFLLERALIKLTPEAAGIVINNNPTATTHHNETHVRIGEHLADPKTRDAVAQLTERLGDRGVFSGGNGDGK